MRHTVLFSFLLFTLSGNIKAQSLDLGIGIGGVVYWGDLNTDDFGTNLSNTNFSAQVVGSYVINDYLSARASLLYGKLSGDDSKSTLEWQRTRNLDFRSVLIEVAAMGEFHVFGYNKLGVDSPFSPFLVGGVTALYFNPQTTLDGQTYDLQPLGTEGQGLPGFGNKYSKIAPALAFGAGVKFKLNESITIVADGVARRAFTDYLDDVSGSYLSFPELAAGNGEIAARLGNRMGEALGQAEPVILPTGSKRGGGLVTDYYITAMVTFYVRLSDNFGFRGGSNTTKCPTF